MAKAMPIAVLLMVGLASISMAKPACEKPDILCIGLVTDVGEVDDKSFNQSAWEGLQMASKQLEAHIKYIETRDAKDYGANISLFLRNHYDIIVTVGFALGEASKKAAKQNPKTAFVGIDQHQTEQIPNLTGLVFDEKQGGFLAGALAAMLSKTGKVAAVFGTDLVPPIVSFRKGFAAGARHIKPDIRVMTTFHPGGLDVAFTDPEWGAATTKQAIDQGADVVFGAGGKTGNGSLVEAANHDGVFCIGVDTDQWETLPEARSCLISSALKQISAGVFGLVRSSMHGDFPGGNYFGDVGLAPFHDFETLVTEEMKVRLKQIESDLKSGRFGAIH